VRIKTACIVLATWFAWSAPARAQGGPEAAPATGEAAIGQAGTVRKTASPRDPGRGGAFELSVSALWLASSSLGSSTANLLSNSTSGSPYRLFTANATLDSTAGFEGRAGYHVTRMFAVEGGVTYSRPGVSFTVTNDAEGAAGFSSIGETLSQFFVDASLVVYPMRRGAMGGKLRPFVECGAGYLRELHGQTSATSTYSSVETGQVYHVGGGARYYFQIRPSGFVKAVGLRFDGRYYFRNGGFTFDGSNAKTFGAGAGLVVGF